MSSEFSFSSAPFSGQPAASEIAGDRIRIDRDAIYRKAMAAPAALREDENFLTKLIGSIRAFIERVFGAILGKRNTGWGDAGVGAAAPSAPMPPGITRDDEHEIATDSLPKSAVEPVQQSINELIDRALGVDLSPSVQAALSMPDADRKPTCRVPIDSNFDNTAACVQPAGRLCRTQEAGCAQVAPQARGDGQAGYVRRIRFVRRLYRYHDTKDFRIF